MQEQEQRPDWCPEDIWESAGYYAEDRVVLGDTEQYTLASAMLWSVEKERARCIAASAIGNYHARPHRPPGLHLTKEQEPIFSIGATAQARAIRAVIKSGGAPC